MALGGFDSGVGKDRRCHVDRQGHFVAADTPGASLARIINDQRDADRDFVGCPLAREAVLTEEESMVGGEDDDGVIVQTLLFQLLAYSSDDDVDARDEAIVVFDRSLVIAG